MKTPKFTPTEAEIKAAKAVFLAMAHTETVRPIVEGYQRELIAYMRPMVASKWRERMGDKEITDIKHTYLMDDNDAKWYYAECDKKAAENGFKTPGPGYCPLLMAENLQIKAEAVLVDCMGERFGMTRHNLLCAGLDKYKQFISLSLKLLAPFVGDSAGILKEYGFAGAK